MALFFLAGGAFSISTQAKSLLKCLVCILSLFLSGAVCGSKKARSLVHKWSSVNIGVLTERFK